MSVFKRRKQRSVLARSREFVWPRAGVVRSTKYLGYRLRRMKGTPYSIACGAACGAAVSMLPLIGLHFFLGGLIAWVLKGNLIASAIGTAVGNPYTFPLIFWWGHTLGGWLMGQPPEPTPDLDFLAFVSQFSNALGSTIFGLVTLDFGYLRAEVVPRWRDSIWPVWYPMFVGGLPTAITAWIVVYFPLRRLIGGYQHRRRRRLVERRLGHLDLEATRARRAAERALEQAEKAEEEAEAAREAARAAADRAARMRRRSERAKCQPAAAPEGDEEESKA